MSWWWLPIGADLSCAFQGEPSRFDRVLTCSLRSIARATPQREFSKQTSHSPTEALRIPRSEGSLCAETYERSSVDAVRLAGRWLDLRFPETGFGVI